MSMPIFFISSRVTVLQCLKSMYLKGGKPPVFKYHRLWAQADIAIANASYGWLFPDDASAVVADNPTETKSAGPARAGAGRAHSSRSKKTKK